MSPYTSDNSGLVANAFLQEPGTPGNTISSTCASVDSDSDYQASEIIDEGEVPLAKQLSETTSPTAPRKFNKRLNPPQFNSRPPSRPLSQASSMSGISTVAFKDGVEGNRPHKLNDSQEYTNWISSAVNDAASLNSSNMDKYSDSGSVDYDQIMTDDDVERKLGPSLMLTESNLKLHDSLNINQPRPVGLSQYTHHGGQKSSSTNTTEEL